MWLSRRQPVPRLAIIALALTVACAPETDPVSTLLPDRPANQVPRVSVFASGFQYPRGLHFGPDGLLYVAEAGAGGGSSTGIADCAQVEPPIGPYTNGRTGRISRVDRQGRVTTVADGFPSSVNAMGDITGVSDLAFHRGGLYALLGGGGCSHGSADVPAGVARVERSGMWRVVANLSAYQSANPVAHPSPGDFEPDGSWFAMISTEEGLLAVEPNHGELVRVDPRTGVARRLVDVSAAFGHVVPTAVVERRGAYYISTLGTFPQTPGTQRVYRISRAGGISLVAEGFTQVLGLAFDRSGRLYVLESSAGSPFPMPGTGRVVRIDRRGRREVVVDGLFLATGLTFGPDWRLYVSNKGFGPPLPGEVLRIEVGGAGDPDDGGRDLEAGH